MFATVFSFSPELSMSPQMFFAKVSRTVKFEGDDLIFSQKRRIKILERLYQPKPSTEPQGGRSLSDPINSATPIHKLRSCLERDFQLKPPYKLQSVRYKVEHFKQGDPKDIYLSQLTDITGHEANALAMDVCAQSFCKLFQEEEPSPNILFTELVNRPRFHCESEDEHMEFANLLKYPPDKNSTAVDPVKDILMPNVLCALLLEVKYAASDKPEALTLKSFLSDYSQTEHDEYMASRYPLTKYPDTIKRLFGISRKGGYPYEIKPLFPELLAALIESQGDVPFHEGPRATNWAQNHSFLENCLAAIKDSSQEAVDSYVSYYLIELIFRLNTKRRLFRCSKEIKQKELLSPQALAGIFYSSPLVYIPDKYITECIYSKEYLHAFIQLSYYWFPVIKTTLRHYFEENDAFNCRTIEEYLLPMCGTIDVPNPKSINNLEARAEGDYNKSWAGFAPPEGYKDLNSYYVYTISEWKEATFPDSYTNEDRVILEAIQEILQ